MTVWVVREGRLVEKASVRRAALADRRSIFPAPMLSRMEPFESPVTGKEISSWRERDRDMAAAGAVDPRELPGPFRRGREAQMKEAEHGPGIADDPFQWHDPG